MPVWGTSVVNAFDGPQLAVHTAYEQRYLRFCIENILQRLPAGRPDAAAEIGAGYGRLAMVGREYFSKLIAFEREAGLIEEARRIGVDDVDFVKTSSLTKLPRESRSVCFSYTCTVLQHIVDEEVALILSEIRRITEGGFVLLIETTQGDFFQGEYGTTLISPRVGTSKSMRR